ncbi:hypothetical protein CONPUDRAFT_155731 [Coniophora puteana RWD-64-598 SS2]|uniref:F-box domain-containing protein n=1 Tax=Coniophora puteana (strain RWD-64-598) TaxID=741705 RepID=A0A5M3MKH2_CONPW|nr:uncharacterized protein CONPUDRAFT_155731 [Coniophora puteana RWD-64-598 SS2]EIW79041.1 hypothetical protein CONPUDRAFT_155731 [Coniophora puteana RWD-64-598 SS2]
MRRQNSPSLFISLSSDDAYISPSSPSSEFSSAYTHTFTSPQPEEPDDAKVIDAKVLTRPKTLPSEILLHIITLFFESAPTFPTIAALSLASFQLREAALRVFFRDLTISANYMFSVVSLHLSLLEGSQARGNLDDVGLGLVSRVDSAALFSVASSCPSLVTLSVSCTEGLDVSCCWHCFTESTTAVVHSPIPNYYASIAVMTDEYAKALKTLTKLTDLHLGVFLSDETMIDRHLDHEHGQQTFRFLLRGRDPFNRPLGKIGTTLSQDDADPSTARRQIHYTGDEEDEIHLSYEDTELDPATPHTPDRCPVCHILVSVPEVRMRELEASLAMAVQLRSLRTVSWSTFFPTETKGALAKGMVYGDPTRVTRAFVRRCDGRVSIRRKAWT